MALNFQRVDPAQGGAETYVADLCRNLVAGRASGRPLCRKLGRRRLFRAQVNVVPVATSGARPARAHLQASAGTPRRPCAQAHHDCSIGFINTWAHDVIIPQGGVQAGSLTANAQRFRRDSSRQAYLLAKTANPKNWLHRLDREQAVRLRPEAAGGRRQQHGQAAHREFHHVPRQQIHVVPNAIDPERLAVSQPGAVRCAFRNRLGLEPRDLVGLFVGHNFALKGLEAAVWRLWRPATSATERPDRFISWSAAVARPARIAGWRRRLGLKDTVHFLGFYPDVEACYWSSDFFVQPTYYDPCSLVVLEALACGLPVITTAQNGASELLTDGREGYILTAPDARGELIAALDHMTDDRRRRTMSAQALRLGR